MNQGWLYENKVVSKHAGKTVLEFYQQFTHSSAQDWHDRIDSGQILLDGCPTTAETHLKLNQILTYHRPPWQEPTVPLELPIIYSDQDLWVINKPSGLPVLPGGQFLENTVLGQLRCRYPEKKLVPIHRLGRGTSGLLLLAQSTHARADLSRQMRDRTMLKFYRTLVGPGITPDCFTIMQPIGKCAYPQLGYLYCAMPSGKHAESHCKVLKRTATATYLEVQITTGRPHQIRIHLASYGFPLQGDPLYTVGGIPYPASSNQSAIPSDCGYTLNAHRLAFQHPTSGQTIELRSSLPSNLLL